MLDDQIRDVVISTIHHAQFYAKKNKPDQVGIYDWVYHMT